MSPSSEEGSFTEVANNYTGPRSFKDSMRGLDEAMRKIGDAYLHIQVRKKEILPNAVPVNFSAQLDVLLGEVVRLLK